MIKLKYALFGFGGHAREVASHMNMDLVYFVDDKYIEEGAIGLSKFNFNVYKLMVAIGDSNLRRTIVNTLPLSTKYFSFVHSSTILLNKSKILIGDGTFIGANCILTNNINIGNHCILNRSVNIGHDVTIGDFVSLMPGVIISGNVNIGNNVYIGSGTILNENISIASNVIIGSNSTVLNNIESNGVYAGNPIKLISY